MCAKSVLTVISLAFLQAVQAAVDGTFILNAPGSETTMNYGDMQYWKDATVARDGGVVSFDSIVLPYFVQNISGLTLGGIRFNGAYHNSAKVSVTGNGITFSADESFLDNIREDGQCPRLQIALKGTGSNTLVKRNVGTIGLHDGLLKDFGRVVLRDGALAVTNSPGGNVLVDSSVGTVAFGGGTLRYSESGKTAMNVPAALDGDKAGGVLNVPSGFTYTFSELGLSDGAGLVVTNAGGMANLGTSEKLVFATAPTMTDGILDPRLVTRDTSVTGAPFSFTKYDAAKGVTAYPDASLTPFASAGEHDIAVVTPATVAADVALGDDKHVASLVVDNRANLVIAEGKTLTVGDGTHTAGVIFREQTDISSGDYDKYSQFGKEKTATGALDFGGSHGVIWKGTPKNTTGRGLDLWTKIKGSNGMTFASRDMGGSGYRYTMFRLHGNCDWTGPTYFQNCRAWLYGPSSLPAGGDVYAIGRRTYGTVEILFSQEYTYDQHFHIGGTGSEIGVALSVAAGSTLTGGLELVEDARVRSGNDAGTNHPFVLDCPVSGPGEMTLIGGRPICFNRPNPAWTGGLLHTDPNTVVIGPQGDLGAGPVVGTSAGALYSVEDHVAAAFTNSWTLAGTLKVDHSDVTLGADVSAARAAFDTRTSADVCSTVSLGGTAAFGALAVSGTRDTMTFTAASGRKGVLKVGADGVDCAFGAGRTDGTGQLAFVKDGSGTVTLLPTHGDLTHTGETRIEKGTLVLGGNPLDPSQMAWHLDATVESSLTVDPTTKAVSEWRSTVGDVVFKPVWTKGPSYTNTLHGLKAVSFGGQFDNAFLASSNTVRQRMVFVVCAPQGKPTSKYYCLFGKKGSDYGFRYNSSGDCEGNISFYKYNTTGYFYCNGVKKEGFARCTDAGAHVLTMTHDCERLTIGTDTKDSPSAFEATIGGYNGGNGSFVGEIAEVIAYDRLLSERERQIVENYLCQRWRGETPYATVPTSENLLSPGSPLVLGYGATLDLNGHDVTVAALSGEGTITNSSATAATLRVTGVNAFAGTIGGRTAVVSSGGGEARLNLVGEASLAYAGGTAAVSTYNLQPPAKDLAYWLDAAVGVTTNSAGAVTSWDSRVAGAASTFAIRSSGYLGPMAVVPNAINGHPALVFGTNGIAKSVSLVANTVTIDRTLFLVGVMTGNKYANSGIYGMLGKDRGIRAQSGSTLQGSGRVNYYFNGDTMRYNGVVKSFGSLDLDNTGTKPFCLALRLDPKQHPDDERQYASETLILQQQSTLGAYAQGSASFRLAEVIAYTNTLTDAEMLSVENYLLDKYALGGHTTPTPRTGVFNGTGGLSVTDGATVSVPAGSVLGGLQNDGAGGTLTGDVTLNGPFVIDAENATTLAPFVIDGDLTLGAGALAYCRNYLNLGHKTTHTALSVTGAITGGDLTLGEPLARRWKWVRQAKAWALEWTRGLLMIVQ